VRESYLDNQPGQLADLCGVSHTCKADTATALGAQRVCRATLTISGHTEWQDIDIRLTRNHGPEMQEDVKGGMDEVVQ
jgi:hypothetical protein